MKVVVHNPIHEKIALCSAKNVSRNCKKSMDIFFNVSKILTRRFISAY